MYTLYRTNQEQQSGHPQGTHTHTHTHILKDNWSNRQKHISGYIRISKGDITDKQKKEELLKKY